MCHAATLTTRRWHRRTDGAGATTLEGVSPGESPLPTTPAPRTSARRPVLVVPGAFNDERAMAPLADALSDLGYRVEVVHTSTRDRRVPQLDPGGLAALDRDVDAAMDELGPDTVAVGHSMGGRLVTRLARRRPVAAAVLLQPVPPVGLGPWVARQAVMAPLQFAKMASLAVTPLAPRLAPGRPPRGLYGRRVSEAVRAEANASVVAEGWRSLAETLLPDPERGPLGVPTLVVAGDEDGIVPAAAAAAAADELGAELWTWTAGHAITLEPDHAERVADLVTWLEEVGAGPSLPTPDA